MKSLKKTIVLGLSLAILVSCGKQQSTDGEDQVSTDAADAASSVSAVCIWNNTSVRKTPSKSGDYVTAINLGEIITSTLEIQTDTTDKNREYVKVVLADGKEGWAIKDFIIAESEPGTFLTEVDIYKRPDLLTKSDLKFGQFDIVAIKEKKDDWLNVVGKRQNGRWLDEGWVNTKNVLTNGTDIAVAKFAQEALAAPDAEKKAELIKSIIENEMFQSSQLYPIIKEQYAEAPAAAEEIDSTTVVAE